MSYVLPPNNAIAKLLSQNEPEDARAAAAETDLELQLRDNNTMKEGNGPVRGWGGGSARRRR